MTQEQIEKAAREIHSWAQSAVYDVAECVEFCEDGEGFGDNYSARETKADDLYDDADTMQDLLGDHVFCHAKGNFEDMNLILKELLKYYRVGGGKIAIERMIKSNEEFLAQQKR